MFYNFFAAFEENVPEVKQLRETYEQQLTAQNIKKNEVERLSDYLYIILQQKNHIPQNEIMERLMTRKISLNANHLIAAMNTVSVGLREKQMEDKIDNISLVTQNAMEEKADFDTVSQRGGWIFKEKPNIKQASDVVRIALNVKPSAGLFKKLDKFVEEHSYSYKFIANPEEWNKRCDPLIIYTSAKNFEEQTEKLKAIAKPYLRHDKYEMPGYQNIGDGLFTAQEVNTEKVITLINKLCGEDTHHMFAPIPQSNDIEKDFELEDKQYEQQKNKCQELEQRELQIFSGEKAKKTLGALIFSQLKIGAQNDYWFSCGQFAAYTALTDAYLDTLKTPVYQNTKNITR